MKLIEYFLIFSVAFLLNSASADDDNGTSTFESPTPVTESTTSTSAGTSSTSTPDPTTPQTLTPNTTTSQTLIPNTTTSLAPASTTPASTTESPVSSDLMLVVNNSGIACIVAKMEITLTLEYENTNKSMVTGDVVITSASVDTDKSSNCSGAAQADVEELYADFNKSSSLHFHFSNTSTNKFAVSLFELSTFDLRNFFPDAMADQNLALRSNESIFETSTGMSYKCNSEMKVDLVDSAGMATNNSVVFRMVQVEAFRTKADTNFANAIDCEADDEISNIVPIAVGCALAGLVVIVLIAYLVGRRQKRQRGYESV